MKIFENNSGKTLETIESKQEHNDDAPPKEESTNNEGANDAMNKNDDSPTISVNSSSNEFYKFGILSTELILLT